MSFFRSCVMSLLNFFSILFFCCALDQRASDIFANVLKQTYIRLNQNIFIMFNITHFSGCCEFVWSTFCLISCFHTTLSINLAFDIQHINMMCRSCDSKKQFSIECCERIHFHVSWTAACQNSQPTKLKEWKKIFDCSVFGIFSSFWFYFAPNWMPMIVVKYFFIMKCYRVLHADFFCCCSFCRR